MLTDQQIYDKIATHLLTQNRKAMVKGFNGQEMCKYRTPEGLKCAIGCLIADEDYNVKLEHAGTVKTVFLPYDGGQLLGPVEMIEAQNNLRRLIFKGLDCRDDYIPDVTRRLLDELQSVHDHSQPKDWNRNLTNLAVIYNLNPILAPEPEPMPEPIRKVQSLGDAAAEVMAELDCTPATDRD
jgi:hypothetical protein